MKTITAFCVILPLIMNSCTEESSLALGYVTGPDQRDCLCCGGYFIDIKGETYRFFNHELPSGSINFDSIDAHFPVKVRVRWKLKDDGCMGDEIIISKVQVVK